MTIDLTPIFAAYFARNRGPDPSDPERRRTPDYGVAADLDGNVINLELTFRCGSAYCCYDYGCHLDLHSRRRWEWLRRELAERQIAVPQRLELRLVVVIEEGALFFDMFKPDPTRRCWYAFAPVEARRYEASATEAAFTEPNTDPDHPNHVVEGGT